MACIPPSASPARRIASLRSLYSTTITFADGQRQIKRRAFVYEQHCLHNGRCSHESPIMRCLNTVCRLRWKHGMNAMLQPSELDQVCRTAKSEKERTGSSAARYAARSACEDRRGVLVGTDVCYRAYQVCVSWLMPGEGGRVEAEHPFGCQHTHTLLVRSAPRQPVFRPYLSCGTGLQDTQHFCTGCLVSWPHLPQHHQAIVELFGLQLGVTDSAHDSSSEN